MRLALITYIEGWYNPRRRHSALDYLSTANYESKNRVRSLRGKHGLPTVGDCVAGATPLVDNLAPHHIEKAENLSAIVGRVVTPQPTGEHSMRKLTTIEKKVFALAMEQLAKPLSPLLLRLQKRADAVHAKASPR